MKTISYDTFRSTIKKIVTESIKNIIKEGISPIVWHFCPINSMYYIAEKNAFQCTSSEHNRSDKLLTSLPKQLKKGYTKKEKYGNGEERTVTKDAGKRFTIDDSNITTIDPKYNKIYNYYMCVSRTPNSRLGYQGRRRMEGGMWSCFCRIELDGYKLMSKFKGIPVNYFTDFNSLADMDRDIKHYISNDKISKTKTGKDRVTQQVYVNNKKNGQYELLSEDEQQYFNANEIKNGRRGTVLHKITNANNGKKTVRKEFMPYNNTDVVDSDRTDMRLMSEYEDRIYTNKQIIEDFDRYILSIDIFVGNIAKRSKEVLYEIKKITENYQNIPINLYDNEVAFNSRNIQASINRGKTDNYNNISKSFLSKINTSKQFSLNENDASALGKYYAAQICNIFLKKYSNGKRGFKGNYEVLKQNIISTTNTLKPYIEKSLNIKNKTQTAFDKGFKMSLEKILSSDNLWSGSNNMNRMFGQRLASIDACKNYLIVNANNIVNEYFGINSGSNEEDINKRKEFIKNKREEFARNNKEEYERRLQR